jgi:hypothetical protein
MSAWAEYQSMGDDPKSLAELWPDLLELEVMFESEDFVALKEPACSSPPNGWPVTNLRTGPRRQYPSRSTSSWP